MSYWLRLRPGLALPSSADYTGNVNSPKVKFVLLFSFFIAVFFAWSSHQAIFAQVTGCTITPPNINIPDKNEPVVFNIKLDGVPQSTDSLQFFWGKGVTELSSNNCKINPPSLYQETIVGGLPDDGWYWAEIKKDCNDGSPAVLCGRTPFQIGQVSGESPMMPVDDRSFFICRDNQGNYRQECVNCITASNWWTVLGCLPTGQASLVQTLVNLITGLAGGISFLMMIKGAFLMMTSQGDTYRLQAGKSSMTKGAAGLVIVLFATVILRTIAADILKLPGFSGP